MGGRERGRTVSRKSMKEFGYLDWARTHVSKCCTNSHQGEAQSERQLMWVCWYPLVISATWEADTEGLQVRDQPSHLSETETLSQNKI